jgi:hypothetical protein
MPLYNTNSPDPEFLGLAYTLIIENDFIDVPEGVAIMFPSELHLDGTITLDGILVET